MLISNMINKVCNIFFHNKKDNTLIGLSQLKKPQKAGNIVKNQNKKLMSFNQIFLSK